MKKQTLEAPALIAVLVILFTVAADAARDAVMCRWDWLPRHFVKWLAFYPTLLWILYREKLKWWIVLILTIFSTFLHRWIYGLFESLPTP